MTENAGDPHPDDHSAEWTDAAAVEAVEEAAGPAEQYRDPRVAEAVAGLEELDDRPPEEHVEVYERVHQVLQETLEDAAGDR